jgi:muramoyltetrapeptide carboxypeptidase
MSDREVMARPRALAAGARVALVAPAGPVTAERIDRAVAQCQGLGLEARVAPSALQRRGFLAGTDEQRLRDLQSALDDGAVDAIWALRGGYGSMRIINQVDWTSLKRRPKPYIGFSDNTAIHCALQQQRIVSFHGPHAGGDFPTETESAFRCVLFQSAAAGVLPLRAQDPVPRPLRAGSVEAPLYGGNLALLAALCGTALSPRARGCILFLEDVGEPAYRVDRMLVQLRQAGALDGVVGLALGRFTECDEQDEPDVMGVLEELAETLRVPTVVDLPVGHVEHNWTVPVGCRARLDADNGLLQIIEPAVRD